MFFCRLVPYGLCPLIPSPSGEIHSTFRTQPKQDSCESSLEKSLHTPICTLSSIYPAAYPWFCAQSHSFIQKIFAELYLPTLCHTLYGGAGDISQNKTDRVSSLTDVMQQDIDYLINIQKCLITIMISVIKDSGCVSMYNWKPNLIWGDQGESYPLKGHLSRNWKLGKTNQAKIITEFPRHKEQHIQRP